MIRGARQLLTLRGPQGPRRGDALRDLGIIPDGALLLREGKILEAGPVRRIENLAISSRVDKLEAGGRVVMPGFVDCHTHMIFAQPALEQYQARLDGEPVSVSIAAPETTVRSMHTMGRLAHRAAQRLLRMVRHGATSIRVESGYGLDETGELKILRAARVLGNDLADIYPALLAGKTVPYEFRDQHTAYFDFLCGELLPKVARRKLAKFADVACDVQRFAVSDIRRYLRTARELRLGISLHAEEVGASEAIRLAIEETAQSIGHLDGCEERGIAALAASSVIAVLTPGTAFHPGGVPLAPARKLIDEGVAVALATNFTPDASPTYSMQMVISLACSRMGMTPAEAISAATINAAHVVGRADRVGSLEPDKSADIIILNVSDYREIPFTFGVNHVHTVVKGGEVIYSEEG
jgi:imidazolonepropionase